MATWITHLMIADGVLERIPNLDRRGFCVGNIGQDCNVENEDWTAFTPSRERYITCQTPAKKYKLYKSSINKLQTVPVPSKKMVCTIQNHLCYLVK